ncbi:MAG TPA: hypothetical protein VMT57_09485 [Candidatus Thermoplasmatota archaeon]|nr:hypothetical protein [Candidatus Thermoplasmatota archaeon]
MGRKKMMKKTKKYLLFVGTVVVILLLSNNAIGISTSENDKKDNPPIINGPVPTGISILEIWTCYYQDMYPVLLPVPFVFLKCKDLGSNETVRVGISGVFGFCYFFFLNLGHSYQITAPYRRNAETVNVTINSHHASVELYVPY